jgi:hypothetical protein
LQATFGQIIIPQAVFHETTGTDFPSSHFVQQAIAAIWLEVRTVFLTTTHFISRFYKELENYNYFAPSF